MCIYIYIYIRIHTHTYVYIYIYIERKRERLREQTVAVARLINKEGEEDSLRRRRLASLRPAITTHI